MADIYSILAGKGRGKDKYIRKVLGKPSHVNEVEKDAIDTYGLLGELFTKKLGTGNINPNTGLPEYDYKKTGPLKWWLTGSDKEHNKSHNLFVNTDGNKGVHPTSHKTGVEMGYVDPQGNNNNNNSDPDPYKLTDAQQKRADQLLNPTRSKDAYFQNVPISGMEDISAEEFSKMNSVQLVDWIIKHKFPGQESDQALRSWLAVKLDEAMPKLQEMSEEEKGFITDQYGGSFDPETGEYTSAVFGPGADLIYGTDDDPGGQVGQQAGLTYGGAGRAFEGAGLTFEGAETAYDKAGLTYDAAGLTYGGAETAYDKAGLTFKGAGIRRGTAETAYELGKSGAERTKGTMLGGLQEQAYTLSSADPTGVDSRAKIRGRGKIGKGFETGMETYKDTLTGVESTWEGAQGAYDIAETTYGMAGETYIDPITGEERLGTLGLAGERYDIAGDVYGMAGETYIDPITGEERSGTLGLAGQRYDLAEDAYDSATDAYELAFTRGATGAAADIYGFEKGYEREWDQDWSSFLATLDTGG